jgi:sugar transferase (PEP-CTERM/EpsH1 system associated)
MKKIIYLSHRIPYPPNKGDKIRSFHILNFLRKKYKVYLGTFIDDSEDERYISEIESNFSKTCIVKPNKIKACLLSVLNGRSISETLYHSIKLENWIDDLIRTEEIEAIFSFSSAMGQYSLKYKDKIKTHIVDYVDVDSEKWREYSVKRSFPLNLIYKREAIKLLAMEKKIANSIHASIFVTEDESALFKQITQIQERIYTVNNGVDTNYFDPNLEYVNPYRLDQECIVFTGRMDYWPNIEAVCWFCQTIFPNIKIAFPNIHFYIVGAKPTETVVQLAKIPGVIVTGQVTDIRPYIKHATLAIAPLKIGRGVQNKVLEAMAMSAPLIVSEEALTGIHILYKAPITIARSPLDWFNAITNTLENPPSQEAKYALRKNILDQYSWEDTLKPLTKLLSQYG